VTIAAVTGTQITLGASSDLYRARGGPSLQLACPQVALLPPIRLALVRERRPWERRPWADPDRSASGAAEPAGSLSPNRGSDRCPHPTLSLLNHIAPLRREY
jgi:hypothetical protein